MQPTPVNIEETELPSAEYDLPEGWCISSLGKSAKILCGQHIMSTHYSQKDNGIPYLTGPSDFSHGRIKLTKYVSTQGVMCANGDVLLTVKGSGVGTLVIADRSYCISRQLMALTPFEMLAKLTYYVLELKTEELNRYSAGTIPGLTKPQVAGWRIIYPLSRTEQARIVEILDAADAAVRATESLIEAKSRYRNALAEQLLTGERRFPEFEGLAWREHRLGALFIERVEQNRPDLRLLSVTGTQGVVYRDQLAKRDTSNEDKAKYLRVAPGDIAYNTMRMWQGVFGLSALEGIVSPAYTVCTPNERIDGRFAAYLFKLPSIIALFYRRSQGLVSDTLNCKFPSFAKIKVTIPDIEEQRKIAEALSLCDEEIALLRRELDALKQQKQALMQKLLTGQVRV